MTNDLSDTTLAKSDQLDAIDLLGHPRTFTITKVTKVEIEGQKRTEISLAEFPRVWRPSTNMRRVLLQVWGKDGDVYVGRQIRLYDDETVTFGKEKTGGIRISHMSHIDGPKDPQVMPSRGKYGTWHVEPLTDPQPVRETDLAACTDPAELRVMWKAAGPQRRAEIEARIAELGPNIASAVSS